MFFVCLWRHGILCSFLRDVAGSHAETHTALVSAQEVVFDDLCEIVDGKPQSIDMLINHVRGWFSLDSTRVQRIIPTVLSSRRTPVQTENGEHMKQCVSRRGRCWTLLTQMDPEVHLSEGYRSDMLLDLSGLTREDRVMVLASISNERDFDRVAEAPIIQHPRIHLRENQRRRGKAKTDSNVLTIQTLVGFAEKRQG